MERTGALFNFGLGDLWERPIDVLLFVVAWEEVAILRPGAEQIGAAFPEPVFASLFEVFYLGDVPDLALAATVLIVRDMLVWVNDRN